MSQDYGSTEGYGICPTKIPYEKLFTFLLNNFPPFKEQMIENQVLSEEDIKDISKILESDGDFIEASNNYEARETIHCGLIAALADYIKYKYPEYQYYIGYYYDQETDDELILFTTGTFPNKIIERSEIDKMFKEVMNEIGVDWNIDYHSCHWFG